MKELIIHGRVTILNKRKQVLICKGFIKQTLSKRTGLSCPYKQKSLRNKVYCHIWKKNSPDQGTSFFYIYSPQLCNHLQTHIRS